MRCQNEASAEVKVRPWKMGCPSRANVDEKGLFNLDLGYWLTRLFLLENTKNEENAAKNQEPNAE